MLKRFVGLVSLVVGAVLLIGGVLAVMTFGTGGSMQTTSQQIKSGTDSYALVADLLGVSTGFPGSSMLGTTTIGARASGGEPVFIGMGPRDAVDQYLSGVSFDAVQQNGTEWQTRTVPGTEVPKPPAQQNVWLTKGVGMLPALQFKPASSGPTTFVVMNQNASPGVSAYLAVRYQSAWIFPLAVGAIILGALLLILGLWQVFKRRRRDDPAVPAGAPAVALDAPQPPPPPAPQEPGPDPDTTGTTTTDTDAAEPLIDLSVPSAVQPPAPKQT